MQFDEYLITVLRRVLWNPVVVPVSDASLEKLYRKIFPDRTYPILLIF